MSAASATLGGPAPLRRFLWRASCWLTALLLAWWFALQGPMMFLLRVSEETVLRAAGAGHNAIVEQPSGDWTFQVPVDDGAALKPGSVKIRSIDFNMPRADVVLFTFALPLFWGIILATRKDSVMTNSLLRGTAAMALAEVLLLFLFLKISAYGLLKQFHPAPDGFAPWLRNLASYLIVSVLPFLLPVIAALASHGGLREHFFPPAPRLTRRR